MIVEYIRYALKEHEGGEFITAYKRAAAQLDASPHAQAWELSRCVEDDLTFILRIEWDSPEGHLEGFRKGPHFPDFLKEIRPFIGEINEMRHYQPTNVASSRPEGER